MIFGYPPPVNNDINEILIKSTFGKVLFDVNKL
jgi:hypothetical protein